MQSRLLDLAGSLGVEISREKGWDVGLEEGVCDRLAGSSDIDFQVDVTGRNRSDSRHFKVTSSVAYPPETTHTRIHVWASSSKCQREHKPRGEPSSTVLR